MSNSATPMSTYAFPSQSRALLSCEQACPQIWIARNGVRPENISKNHTRAVICTSRVISKINKHVAKVQFLLQYFYIHISQFFQSIFNPRIWEKVVLGGGWNELVAQKRGSEMGQKCHTWADKNSSSIP